jgi:hypothetical protein
MIKKIFSHSFWSSKENLLAAGFLSIAMIIRVIDVFTRNFDSDEPQHLHVIWGWAHGYLQYRDIFDNHTPLFQMLFAPLFALLPEWHGALYVMRLATFPFYLSALLCTYLIGKTLFSPRAGLWSMVILAMFGRFFIKTLEFRPDSLWAALLVAGVYLFVRQPMTKKFSLLVGIIFGAALSVSFKTTIMLVAVIVALPLTWTVVGSFSLPALKNRLKNFGYGIIGLFMIPIVLVIVFYSLHALPEFYYGVIQHNAMAHGKSTVEWSVRVFRFIVWMSAIACFARYISSVTQDEEKRQNRVFVMAAGFTYCAILSSFWPIVTHQTQLPMFPLLIVSLVPFLTGEYPVLGRLSKPLAGAGIAPLTLLLVIISATELIDLTRVSSMVGRHLYQNPQLWKDVLKYTDPGDYVMDAKGESIFRMRPYFYGFETITMQLVASGAIPDNAADSLIVKPTYVVAAEKFDRYPNGLKTFVQANYLRAGTLFIAGKKLANIPADAHAVEKFSLALPGRYAIVNQAGQLVPGALNGQYGTGVFDMKAGQQEFAPMAKVTSLTVIWDKAWERGIRLSN